MYDYEEFTEFINKFFFVVVEWLIYWWRLIVKLIGNIRFNYVSISNIN